MPPHCEFAWRPPTFRVCSAVPPPPRDFVGSLLHCEPKIDTQLTLLAMQCLFWMIVIPVVGGSVIKPWLSRKAWRENFITRSQASLSKGFFIDLDRAATLEFMCGLLVILAQHGVGAALCVPAVLLGCDPTWSHPLACHGALCEAGYELSDVLTRAYQLAALPEKRSLSPPPLLVLLGVHHAMGLSMVVPMNLHYPSAPWYHEGAMLLQGAAAVALLLQCYGFTLDITRPSHLRQMQLSLAVGWVALFYSRGLRYAQVALEAVFFFEREGAAGMRRGALVASALMGAMNVLVLLEITGKTLKFLRLSAKTPAPEDAPAHFEELQDLAEDSLSAPAGPALAPIRPLAALSARQRGFAKWRGAGVMVQHQLSVRRAKQA